MTHAHRAPIITVSALGTTVAVELSADASASLAASVQEAWADAVAAEGSPEHVESPEHVVRAIDADDEDEVLERLSVQVTLQALEAWRGSRVMFHAAGVADERGRVAAFVGPSGRGKTTLSRALGPHLGYVSDESVAVDEGLRVYPYRKPLSVVRHDGPKEQVSPRRAGLSPLPDAPLILAALILLDRRAGGDGPTLEPVSTLSALPDLVPQISYLADLDRPLQRLCALIDQVGGVQRLVYAEATSLPAMVAALLRDGPTAPSDRSPWAPATTVAFPRGVVDAVVVDDGVVILARNTVHVLGGIAPEVWLRTVEGCLFDDVVRAVVNRYGPAPDGEAAPLVHRALDELRAAGLLDSEESFAP